MSSNRDMIVPALTLLINDSKAIGRSFWLIYNPMIVGLFVWTAIDPTSRFSLIPVSSEVSATSHLIGEFSIVNAFLAPFVFYTSIIYESIDQKRAGSFTFPRILPIDASVEEKTRAPRSISLQALTTDTVHLFWARVFSCGCLSLVPFLLPYLLYLCLHLLELLPQDNLTPILVGVRFPVLITSLTLLASALAVGIGYNANRKWSLVLAAIVILPVLFGGIIFDALQGTHERQCFINLLERYGATLSAPVLFIGLALLMSLLFKTTFRYHNAGTR